ncbi:MAG: peptide-methionine (S)-S-oxide reductase MsrA [Bacteroidales bacterium]|nr:peptide-methionine (S)-S-oxide reductase MsrA [Bacteroidales bacterium]
MTIRLSIILLFGLLLSTADAQPQIKEEDKMSDNKLQTATFGSGCFWCTEAVFKRVKGVKNVTSGYAGGKPANPTYREVSSGQTGHAEVVQINYDPEEIAYEELLQIFWRTHNPTTLNRQGADVGTQYRSVIFFHNQEQLRLAKEYKEKLDNAGIWEDPIVTEISPYEAFYPAEEYHQDYYEKNPNAGYCQFVIIPKLEKFQEIFGSKIKEKFRE